jgi:hypothetical protein
VVIHRVLCAALALAALPLGCRAILGIEERELTDGGADAGDALTCDAYCDAIMANCTGNNQQYATRDACMGLCSTFPRGNLGDSSGNSLGCRLTMAKIATEIGDCAAAGPGGNDTCGSNCASFCAGAMALCPGDFTDEAACESVCNSLPTCGTYHVDPATTPDDPSIQCRLYHLSSASIGQPSDAGETPSQTHHCPHVAGIGECVLPDAGTATCDGGT